MSKALYGMPKAQVRPAHAAIELMLRPSSIVNLETQVELPVPDSTSSRLLPAIRICCSPHQCAVTTAVPPVRDNTAALIPPPSAMSTSNRHVHMESPACAGCARGPARDLEEGVPRTPSERDPLCSLATNRGNDGMQGKWRLAIAIVLCTIFMIGEVGWPGLLAMHFAALHGRCLAPS